MLKRVKNVQLQYRSSRGECGESALKTQDKAHKRWIHPSFETQGRRHQANGLKFSKSQWWLCYLIDTLKIQMLLFWNQWKTPLKDTCYYFCLVVSVGVLFPYTQVQQDSLSIILCTGDTNDNYHLTQFTLVSFRLRQQLKALVSGGKDNCPRHLILETIAGDGGFASSLQCMF